MLMLSHWHRVRGSGGDGDRKQHHSECLHDLDVPLLLASKAPGGTQPQPATSIKRVKA